jgi:hypothetical protein
MTQDFLDFRIERRRFEHNDRALGQERFQRCGNSLLIGRRRKFPCP